MRQVTRREAANERLARRHGNRAVRVSRRGCFRWLFLETAMLATGALRCPLDREGLLGAQTNSPRRPSDGCRAEEFPWRPNRSNPGPVLVAELPAPARSRPQPTAWGRPCGIAKERRLLPLASNVRR